MLVLKEKYAFKLDMISSVVELLSYLALEIKNY